ncbi:MAG: polyhydroxyalkanoate synthesis repressor PhaR [Alphaproteobacteria bacterium]|nr:polyhydroxyalkanoate synthesis repressor PhaR [Alphaproteobacteria bacterium]
MGRTRNKVARGGTTLETELSDRNAVADRKSGADSPVIIKKYANRRLYNTATSSYVTLDHLAEMVRKGTEFEVQDAKSGEDITRSVLAQIIFEEESKGQNLLPIRFLRQLIKFYGDSLQGFLPGYLEASLESFTRNQEKLRERVMETFGGRVPGLKEFEEISRNNMAMFERAMRMWTPFPGMPPGPLGKTEEGEKPGVNGTGRTSGKGETEEIDDLKKELEAMKRQIEELARGKDR